MARIEDCSNASELLKSVNVLTAIRWAGEAWKKVTEVMIKKCFHKAGVLSYDFSLIQSGISPETDIFADIDEQQCGNSADEAEVRELLHRVQGSENSCSISEMFIYNVVLVYALCQPVILPFLVCELC